MSTATASGPRSGRNPHGKRSALAVLCTVLFVTFLDNTIVSVTLANIQSQLHAGVQTLQWVVNGYALAFASLMLIGGMLGDHFGRRRVMLSGLLIFAAGSAIAAAAPDATWLLVGRVVMGLGAAGSEPGTLSIVRHVYEDRAERARALGAWAAVSGTALAMGPVVAGVIVGFSDWRGVFWFNLALVAVAFVATLVFVPESADPDAAPIDVPGAALGAVALASAIFAVIEGETAGYATWWIIVLFVLSGAAAAGFVVVELRRRHPMLDLRLLRTARLAVPNVVAFTTYFGVFSIFFFVALYLQLLAGQSPFSTALDFVPMTVVMIAASALAGRWVARSGPRLPMTVGCVAGGIGILLVDVVLGPHVGFGQLSWTLAIAGGGFGIALVPVTSAAMSAAPEERSGMAASATNTSRELGAVFGVAILGAVVNGQLTSNLTQRLDALGIPPNFQSIVMEAVTHGGVPQNAHQAAQQNAAAAHAGPIVDKVIGAAQQAFYTGLHSALLVSACLLLASAVLAWAGLRAPVGVAAPDRRARTLSPVPTVLRAGGLMVLVVAAAVLIEAFLGTPTGGGATTATTTSAAPSTSAAGAGGAGAAPTGPSRPTLRITPSAGLHDGQQVQVVGAGFRPGTSLVALECVDRGDQTSSADCALSGLSSVTASQDGSASTTLRVTTGPVGSAKRTCGRPDPCEITLSAPSASSDAQRATAPISFGG